HFLDVELVEQVRRVVRVLLHGIRRYHGRIAEAAQIDGAAPAPLDQGRDLRSPHRAVQWERMQEQQGRAAPAVVVAEVQRVYDRDQSPPSGHCGSISRHESGTRTGLPSCAMATNTMFASATFSCVPTLRTSCRTM